MYLKYVNKLKGQVIKMNLYIVYIDGSNDKYIVKANTKKEAEDTLMKVMTFVTEELVQGNSLKLVGFLELGTKVRSAKVVRSIHTGELTETPAKRVPYCKFGKTLKNKIME